MEALEIMEALEEDDRLLRALDVLHKIEMHLVSHTSPNAEIVRAALARPERVAKTERLQMRAKESLATLADFEDVRVLCFVGRLLSSIYTHNSSTPLTQTSAWTFDHSLFGVDTYYRREDKEPDGSGGGLYVMVVSSLCCLCVSLSMFRLPLSSRLIHPYT